MRFGSEGVGLPNFIISLSFLYSVYQTVFPIDFPEQSHIQRKKGCLKGCFPSMLTQSNWKNTMHTRI
jgi:hypothetical protein